MKSVLPLAALALACLASGPLHAQTDALQARNWAASCTGCHGTNGRAQPGNVSLAGQDKDEMLRTLLDFKRGVRPATVMEQLSKGYTDEQLAAIAEWFARQPK